MKKHLLLIFLLAILPLSTFADIAGPTLTKDQACLIKDGPSWNRLQVQVNNQKKDTLYFYKYKDRLYYTVSLFPYTFFDREYYLKHQYYAADFLYQYECNTKKITRISDNLKPLAKTVWGPVNGEEKISPRLMRELGYGQISQVTHTGIVLNLFIPQTGIYSNNITISPINL